MIIHRHEFSKDEAEKVRKKYKKDLVETALVYWATDEYGEVWNSKFCIGQIGKCYIEVIEQ